jgi:xylono-1,5-lactonase
MLLINGFDWRMAQAATLWISAHHKLAESIIWHEARQKLFWVDLLDPALFSHDLNSGGTTRHPLALLPPIGSIAATVDPERLVLAHRGGLSLLHIDTLTLEPYCDPECGRDAIIYNDMKVDRWGRLWVGTSDVKEQDARGALWCVAGARNWALADMGFAVSNGPAFAPDGKTMYFNDSVGRKTLAYDIEPGSLTARNRRILVQHQEHDGMPDGVVVDDTGNIWTAQWGGAALLVFAPDGKSMARHPVPAWNVTTLCFAGPLRDTVYVTSATDGMSPEQLARYPLSGSLFEMHPGANGVAEPLFDFERG